MGKRQETLNEETSFILDSLGVARDQIERNKETLGYESLITNPSDPISTINEKMKVSTFITKELLSMTREYMELTGIMEFYKKSTEKGKKEKIRGGTTPTGFESILNKK